ncbi:MAG: YeeE/YedE thiosulfate transporter family protein, partial [Spirochaeta sp.]
EQPKLTRQFLLYFPIGIYFGIVLSKAEVISWYRIQEMFAFQAIHMYGIIGSAVAVGALSVALIRAFKLKYRDSNEFNLIGKPFNKIGNLSGGVIFGLGWALTGACPGPLYALVGLGYYSYLIAIAFALLGVITYGKLRPHLPH